MTTFAGTFEWVKGRKRRIKTPNEEYPQNQLKELEKPAIHDIRSDLGKMGRATYEHKHHFSLFCERKMNANVVTDQQLHIP